MAYAKNISNEDGTLVVDKVIKKMNDLYQRHTATGAGEKMAANIAFEYGRNLIGYDAAESWKSTVA